jgi:hypothetical protein
MRLDFTEYAVTERQFRSTIARSGESPELTGPLAKRCVKSNGECGVKWALRHALSIPLDSTGQDIASCTVFAGKAALGAAARY